MTRGLAGLDLTTLSSLHTSRPVQPDTLRLDTECTRLGPNPRQHVTQSGVRRLAPNAARPGPIGQVDESFAREPDKLGRYVISSRADKAILAMT